MKYFIVIIIFSLLLAYLIIKPLHAETITLTYKLITPNAVVSPHVHQRALPVPAKKSTPKVNLTKLSGGLNKVLANTDIELKVYEATCKAFGCEHWDAMHFIVSHESGFRVDAWNQSSGAGGLFQALPFSKTGCELEDADCQIKWGMQYVKNRYGNPANARAFWEVNNWY